MSHFNFFRRDYGPGYPEDDRLRQFIRRNRKIILIVLVFGAILALFLAVLAGLLLFKVIIPALLGSADSPAFQSGFTGVKSWFAQLVGTNPLQWISLLLQAGG